jgi:hypothetical protein
LQKPPCSSPNSPAFSAAWMRADGEELQCMTAKSRNRYPTR